MKKAGLHVVLTQSIKDAPEDATPLPRERVKASAPPPGEPLVKASEPEKIVRNAPLPFEFRGTGSEYFKIWIINIILSIITLGIYSAWAKVRRKQYFYGSTQLENSSFEYLADPVKIFKGRIIVIIFFVFYSVISEFFPLAGGVLSLLFLLILPWLVIRALTFNARNSAYRNMC